MDILQTMKKAKETDDNVGRTTLDPKTPPTITDWYREREQNKKRHIDFL
jgi:hypothetical protein